MVQRVDQVWISQTDGVRERQAPIGGTEMRDETVSVTVLAMGRRSDAESPRKQTYRQEYLLDRHKQPVYMRK